MKTKIQNLLQSAILTLAIALQLFAPATAFASPAQLTDGPTVVITSASTNPTSDHPISFTATFSADVTGFELSDISVTNGTAANFVAVSAVEYTFDVYPTNIIDPGFTLMTTPISVSIPEGAAVDELLNLTNASDVFNITYETYRPGVVITTASSQTNTSPFEITIEIDDAVDGFTVDDISVGNGAGSNLVATGASTYTADITPTADGEVTVDVAAGAFTRSSLPAYTNTAALQLKVTYDGTAPSVTITSNETSPTNVSPIGFTITFTEEVTGFDLTDFLVTNGTASNLQTLDNIIFTADITPTADGTVAVDLAAGAATDLVGNGSLDVLPTNVDYDTTAPTIVISSTAGDPTGTSPIPVTFTFSEDVTGFDTSDITVGNGSVGNFVGTGSVYTVEITPTTIGTVTVDVADDAAQDGGTNGNLAATQFSIAYDNESPIASLIMGLGETASNTSPLIIGASFSKVVTGFDDTDLIVTNGTVANFIGSGDAYEFEVTPTAEGLVTIQIPVDSAFDSASNGNTEANLEIVYDITSPTLTITSGEIDPTSTNPFEVTFTFDEDVDNFEGTDVVVGNGSIGNFAGTGSVYTADITPASSALVTVDVAADVANDPAGNFNLAADQFSITFIGSAVIVEITSGEIDPTNATPFEITVTFSEAVSGFELGDISVGNGSVSNLLGSGAVYTALVTPAGDGLVTVDIPADVVIGIYDNSNLAAVQFSITFDITSPSVAISSLESVLTNLSPFEVTITFSADVTGFTLGDISVGNGTASDFAGSGSVYTANITPTADGTVTVDIAAGVAIDTATNPNTVATQFSIEYDGTRPSVIVSSVQTTPTNDSPITFTIAFSENVTGLGASDFTATNGVIGSLSGSGSSYNLTVAPSADGFVTLTLGDEQCEDAAGNRCEASVPYTIQYDIARPGVVITNPTDGHFTFTFTESVTGFAIGDIAITGGTLSNFAGTGAVYTADVNSSAATVTLSVPADVATDAAGNMNTASATFSLNVDTVSPSLLSILRLDANPTKVASVRFSVTFSEPIDSLDTGDLALAQTGISGAAITAVSGSGSIYTVTVSTGTGTGTIELRLSTVNNIQDLTGNLLSTVTVASQVYNIDRIPVTLSASTLQLNLIQAAAFLNVQFSEDVYNPVGNTETDDVTNPNNFLLLKTGPDGVYNTTNCAAGVSAQDVRITVNSVNYNSATFTATLNVNNGLPLNPGNYRLIICGTTSVTDLAGNSLNGGNDVTLDLVVWDRNGQQPMPIPVTGFAPASGAPTGFSAAYRPTGATITIGSIGLNAEMVSVPFKKNDWDIAWLGDKVGVLVGLNNLSKAGNTVITGHNWDYDDTPGPFLKLTDIALGEKISIATADGTFVFTVIENEVVDQYDLDAAFATSDQPTITLITCDGYDAYSKTFTQRRIVRAVIE